MATVQKQIFALGGDFTEDMDGPNMPAPLPLLFTYNSESPLAIKVRFMGADDDLFIDRNSLFTGRYIPQTLGDIRITPAIGEGAPDNTTVLAIVQGSSARIALIDTDDLSSFLSDTQRLVPLGEEQVGIDSAIEQLLKEAGN